MDGIIVDFDIIHNTCTLFDLNARPTCTPMIERVYYVIVKFYFIRVPYSKSAVSSAGYEVIPGFYVLTPNCKHAVVSELVYSVVVKLNVFTLVYSQPVSHSIMHIHIVYFYVTRVSEVNHIIVSFSQYDFTITSIVYIDLKAPYCNVVVSRTAHLLDQGFHRRPPCVISQFDHGIGIPFKNCITVN